MIKIKNLKGKYGMKQQKVGEQGIRFWDERTFWYEINLKFNFSLLLTNLSVGLPKVEIKLRIIFLKLSHARMFSHPKILFLVPLLFVASIPTYLLNF